MSQFSSATPPAAPLTMPTQVLSRHPGTRFAPGETSHWLARLLTFGGCLVLTAAASFQMARILPLDGGLLMSGEAVPVWVSLALWLVWALFTLTFGWVALTAMAAVSGVFYGDDSWHGQPDAPLRGRTVLLMPIYHEDPVSACAALAAMAEDLAARELADHFEVFILSDSKRPEVWAAEEAAVDHLRTHLAGILPVWYRRRDLNTARKAGNIRDFIERWGDRYDYMVVLDADSLIAGETLAQLVREMDADSSAGIVQTLPGLFGGETLYARLQQFAGRVYGPVFARGLHAWQGHDGNYWGHNAILRVRAFAESAGLPCMPGPRPFGGEIRSHDFVEAALIRRAGWKVRMLPGLPGSWEECPPTLLDAAVRDRRWAQGNMQHLAVVSARGLRWPNRAHMLMGVMNYVTSPLWLALVVVGLLLSGLLDSGALQVAGQPWPLAAGLVFDSEHMIRLFVLTMVLLLLPKLLGVVSALRRREGHGRAGRIGLVASAALELVLSILYAPVVMMLHSRHLWEILRGQDSGWSAQQRTGRVLPWSELLRRHGGQTALGALFAALLLWLSSPLWVWMLPMLAGLLLAIPLSALSGSRRVARVLVRLGLLETAEELTPPAIMLRRLARREQFAASLSRGDHSSH
jgi:membrane glycosyltransferase